MFGVRVLWFKVLRFAVLWYYGVGFMPQGIKENGLQRSKNLYRLRRSHDNIGSRGVTQKLSAKILSASMQTTFTIKLNQLYDHLTCDRDVPNKITDQALAISCFISFCDFEDSIFSSILSILNTSVIVLD